MAGLQKDVSNIHNLRNLMKRDPLGYFEEFKQQYAHFQANLEIFKLKETINNNNNNSNNHHHGRGKSSDAKQFGELVEFLAHVIPHYPKHDNKFAEELLTLISEYYDTLEPYLRKCIVQSLIMLNNRDLIPRLQLLPALFRLFGCRDKVLRKLIFSHIINDIRRVNKKTSNHKLNNTLMNYIFNLLKDENLITVKKSLEVMMTLWQKNIWRNDKVANAIMNTCFHNDTSITRASLLFFTGQYDHSDDDDTNIDVKDVLQLMTQTSTGMQAVKHTKKRQRELNRMRRKLKQANKELNDSDDDDDEAMKRAKSYSSVNTNLKLPAIHMIYDPQSFAERLFTRLRKSNQSFEVRLLMMNVISRFVGAHKLILFNFYPFLQKYMSPHQDRVTLILTYLAQSSHDLVPPEVLQPCLLYLANNFVTDRSSPEIMAVGLNAIREICARCPLAITEELLQDLVQYKASKTKGVMMAARSLIALYREVAPSMLHKRDRGKSATLKMMNGEKRLLQYGEEIVVDGKELMNDNNDADNSDENNDNKRRRLTREDGTTLLNNDTSEFVDEDDIIGYVPRLKADKAARLASVEEGRGDRSDFKRARKEKGGGTTNTEKQRHQPFQLQKYSRKVKAKQTSKYSDKLKRKSKHIKKMKQQALKKRRSHRRV